MNLKKKVFFDQITVTPNGVILCRQVTKIVEDEKELSQTYHRTTLVPGGNLTGQDPKVVAIANAVWTEEVIEDYKASLLENDNLAS